MIKRTALICFSLLASSIAVPGLSYAQFVLPTPVPMHEPEAAPAIPDDVHIVLMIRNAVIALSQANITGNYTVVREMGTADFQMTNSPARLAEIFATLRSRKIDLSPVMVFSPKLTSGPALDGQVLRVAGYFPTSPEQVQFELAYQHAGDQWLLGGIAVSVAPPADGAQASAAPAGQLLQASAEPVPPPGNKADPHRFEPAWRRAGESRRTQEASRGEKAEAAGAKGSSLAGGHSRCRGAGARSSPRSAAGGPV